MFTQAAIAATAIATAKVVLQGVEAVEQAHGPQKNLRHWLHGAQAELERILGMAPGTILPDGGTNKPPSS